MRYRLSSDGSLNKHLCRLLQSINDDIALALLRAVRDPETGIHEARKGCKEIRGILRLLRPQLGEREFSYWQDFYRSLSGKLSGHRDHLVREQTWQNLVSETPRLQRKAFVSVARFLSLSPEPAIPDNKSRDTFLALALDVVEKSDMFGGQDLAKSLAELLPNLKTIYQKTRDAEKIANGSDDIESFHRFRKRSKDLFYCLRVLKPVFGKSIKPIVANLQKLTEVQGLANDQAVLLEFLTEHRDALDIDDSHWELVESLITKRLFGFQKQSHKMAKKLLSESPGAFIKFL